MTVAGAPSWEIYNNDTNQVVRTFFQRNYQDAMVYAGQWLIDNGFGLDEYGLRPTMETNESRALHESAMMGKIESTGKIVRILRKEHSVKFSDQKDWLLIDTDPGKGDRGTGLKWVPASTRFEWVRPYRDTVDEDYGPNDPPPGPETKPTMPAGTVRVDVSDTYDWYKLGKHIANLDRADPGEFGKGPPSTIVSFGDEDTEHKYINALKKLGLDTIDIDPVDPDQPPGMPRQTVDPTYNVDENFADGQVKGKSRPGRVKRAGASCKGSVTDLRARAEKSSGERKKMYQWCANMKSGKAKAKKK
jgi:hypothetical protein